MTSVFATYAPVCSGGAHKTSDSIVTGAALHSCADTGASIPPSLLQGAPEISQERGVSTSPKTSDKDVVGGVTPQEAARAVRDMLGAAGLPLDLETEALTAECLRLKTSLASSEGRYNAARTDTERLKGELDMVKCAWQCRICLQADVGVTLIPCGHSVCEECSASLDRCPFCRSSCQILRLFR